MPRGVYDRTLLKARWAVQRAEREAREFQKKKLSDFNIPVPSDPALKLAMYLELFPELRPLCLAAVQKELARTL